MAVGLEIMETKLAEGGEGVDLDLYLRVAGHQSRILERLGIKKVEQRSKDFLEVVAEIGKGNRVA